MRYSSTRGQDKNLLFEEAVMMGLADDGGLLVPDEFPQVKSKFHEWRALSFSELSLEIMLLFTSGRIPREEFTPLAQRSYTNFRHPKITPVKSVGQIHILELFHGPTFAFKDVALQFLGNLFECFLAKRDHPLRIIGATSGDTGSAAIHGMRGKKGVDVFMLHPKGRVSPIQELQMTTVLDSNIHNLAIEGSFDDAQAIVKALFNDQEFKHSYHLGSVNSINWARILAQIVYYFYAWFQVTRDNFEFVSFAVPTGNFGDVYAGYLSKNMGLPIDKLLVATNQNDILFRAISSGDYSTNEVKESISPSMDIQVASNFERLIYDLLSKDSNKTNDVMKNFKKNKNFLIDTDLLNKLKKDFISEKIDENETINEIKSNFENYNIILDPHTAIGVGAVNKLNLKDEFIILSTAHPCKFPDATNQAINKMENLPNELNYILNEKENFEIIDNSSEKVKTYIKKKLI